MSTKLLTLEETTERLGNTHPCGMSLHTIRRYATMRLLPTVRIGRRVFVPEKDLEKWIAARYEAARCDIAV